MTVDRIQLVPSAEPGRRTAGNKVTRTQIVFATQDTDPPTFGGITSATALTSRTARLTWDAAIDEVTAIDAIWYEVHVSYEPGAAFEVHRVVHAADVLPPGWEAMEIPIPCSFDIDGLLPLRTYFFRVRARDASGNTDTNTAEQSATTTGDTPGVYGPVVKNASPAPNQTISRTQPVTFRVTDEPGPGAPEGFRRILVAIYFPRTGVAEVAHDGDSWTAYYAATSYRTALDDGWQYSILRTGGWPSSPTFKVFAIDAEGNEAGTLVMED
jgi:hypothetical protein